MSIWKKKKITECDIAVEYLKRKKIKQEKLSIQKNWSCASARKVQNNMENLRVAYQ